MEIPTEADGGWKTQDDVAQTLKEPLKIHEEEAELLMNLYQNQKRQPSSTTRVVAIHGPPGVGRTTLAERTLRDAVLNDDGSWIHFKFDSSPHPEPFQNIIEGLSAWVDALLCRGKEEDVTRTRMLVEKTMAEDFAELCELIPPIARLCDQQGSKAVMAKQLSETSAWTKSAADVHRFGYFFRRLVWALSSSPVNPVVLLLDDVDLANSVTGDLLVSFVQKQAALISPFLFVVTKQSKSLPKKLGQLWFDEISMSAIALQELDEQGTRNILEQLLGAKIPISEALFERVFRITRGNLFYIMEYAQCLLEKYGSAERKESEESLLHHANEFSTDLVSSRIELLPDETQLFLRLAACVGFRLHNEIVFHLVGPADEHVQLAVEHRLLVDCASGGFKFAHSCIQEAVYRSIPVGEQSLRHYNIGRRLWKVLNMEELDNLIFLVVDQLLKGEDHIRDQKQRHAIAKLCLRAGEKAAASCSFKNAYRYLTAGIALLGPQRWHDEYSLCLDLYSGAAEVSYYMASFSQTWELTDEVFANARTPQDLRRVQLTKLYTLGTSGRTREAIDHGCSVLAGLQCSLPACPNPSFLGAIIALKRIAWRLRGKSDEMLMRLPVMSDPNKLAAMQVLSSLMTYAVIARRGLVPFIAHRLIALTLDHGLCTISALGFVLYGHILSSAKLDIDAGYRYGLLALKLQRRFSVNAFHGRVNLVFYASIFGFKRPFTQALEHLDFSRRLSLQFGDTESAMLCSNAYYLCQLDTTPIPKLVAIVSGLQESMRLHGQDLNLMMSQPCLYIFLNLSARTDGDFGILRHALYDEAVFESTKTESPAIYLWGHYSKMTINFIFGDYDKAWTHSQYCAPLLSNPSAFGDFSVVPFFLGMTSLEMARRKESRRKRGRHIREARRCLQQLQLFASHAPGNFLGRMFLLEAEMAAVKGQDDVAHQKYTCAISLSRDAGFYLLTALAYERAGRWCLQTRPDDAFPYFEKAVSRYREQGADAKVEHLELEMDCLFTTERKSLS